MHMSAGYRHRTTLATAKKLRLKPGRAKTTVLVLADPHTEVYSRPQSDSSPHSDPTPSPPLSPLVSDRGDTDPCAQDRHDAEPTATEVRGPIVPWGVRVYPGVCRPSVSSRSSATDALLTPIQSHPHNPSCTCPDTCITCPHTSTHARTTHASQLKIQRLLKRRAYHARSCKLAQ